MLSDCKSQRFKAGSSGGQYLLLLSSFFVKSTAKNSVEGTKESSPYTNPLKIHMPIIFTSMETCVSVQSYWLSMKDRCAVTVLVYNGLVTSVLHPVSRGAPQSHEVMYHKPPVISGYGNISQALHIDYGFIMSQPGNFSLNGSLKLVSTGKCAVKQQTVSIHPTVNKHTKRSRVL